MAVPHFSQIQFDLAPNPIEIDHFRCLTEVCWVRNRASLEQGLLYAFKVVNQGQLDRSVAYATQAAKAVGLWSPPETCDLGDSFMVFESVGSLKPLPRPSRVEDFLQFFVAVAEKLSMLHDSGLIHGSLNANTAFWDGHSSESIRLFGAELMLSGEFAPLKSNEKNPKSICHLPPEVLVEGVPMNYGVDIFGLGCLAYQWIVGQAYFLRPTVRDTIRAVAVEIPKGNQDGLLSKNCDLKRIIDKCLHKFLHDRYESVASLLYDLKSYEKKLKNRSNQFLVLGKAQDKREYNLHPKLIGREKEWERLQALVKAAKAGEGSVVSISGFSGNGKTRLAQDFVDEAKQNGAANLDLKFTKFEENLPLNPVSRMFCTEAQKLLDDPAFLQRVKQITSENPKGFGLIAERMPQVAACFGIRNPSPKGLTLEQEELLFFSTLALSFNFFRRRDQELIVLVDDCQWADRSSIELLNTLVNFEQKQGLGPIIVLCTYRSEEVATNHPLAVKVLSSIDPSKSIIVDRLSQTGCTKIVADVLGESENKVEDFANAIFHLSFGSPFFTIEYVQEAVRRKVYRRQKNADWIFDPGSMNQLTSKDLGDKVILARLSELSLPARRLIAGMAILANRVSTVFMSSLYAHFFDTDKNDCDGLQSKSFELTIDELSRAGVLKIHESWSIISHDRVRAAARDMVPQEDRPIIHLAYADYLSEQISWGGLSEIGPEIYELSHHLAQAGLHARPELAKKALAVAAEKSFGVFAFEKALLYCEQIIEKFGWQHAERSHDLWNVYLLRADCMRLLGHFNEAIKEYGILLNVTTSSGEKARILSHISASHQQNFMYVHAVEASLKGLRLLGKKVATKKLTALISVIFWQLPLGLLSLVHNKKDKKELTAKDQAVAELSFALQIQAYMTNPLVAICCGLQNLRWLRGFKESRHHCSSMLVMVVGALTLGLEKFARRLLNRARAINHRHYDVINDILGTFLEGYLADMVTGDLPSAKKKLLSAIELADKVGEKFWKLLCVQGLFELSDRFCVVPEVEKYIPYLEEINRVSDIGTALGVPAWWLEARQDKRFESYFKRAVDYQKSREKGQQMLGLDYAYLRIWLGEHAIHARDWESAGQFFGLANRYIQRNFHRITFSLFIPIRFAHVAARCQRRLTAVIWVLFGWLNVWFVARGFRVHALEATGEVLASFNLRYFSKQIFKRAIRDSMANKWDILNGRIRLGYAERLMDWGDYANAELQLTTAGRIFQGIGLKLLYEQAENLRLRCIDITSKAYPCLDSLDTGEKSIQKSLKETLDMNEVLNLTRRLTRLSSREVVYQELLETLSFFFNADQGVVFELDRNTLKAVTQIGISQSRLDWQDYLGAGLDVRLIESIHTRGQKTKVRNLSDKVKIAEDRKSILLTIEDGQQVFAWIYLGLSSVTSKNFNFNNDSIVQGLLALCSVALSNLAKSEQAVEGVRLEQAVQTASAVQNALLAPAPKHPKVDLATIYKPAEQLGGDWYGFTTSHCQRYLCIYLGDVTGHGVASALVTGLVCGGALSYSLEHESCHQDPAHWLQGLAHNLNNVIKETAANTHSMTMFISVLDTETGILHYINAAHQRPLFLGAEAKKVRTILSIPQSHLGRARKEYRYNVSREQLNPGDRVFLYTDGLVENENTQGKQIADRTLRKFLSDHRDQNAETLANKLDQMIDGFLGEQAPDDDTAIVIIDYLG